MDEQSLSSQNALPVEERAPIPPYTLYTQGQVFVATFLGGPLGGAWLMGANYAALGQEDKKNKALLYGGLATILLLIFGIFILPENIPSSIIPIISCILMTNIAKSQQGLLIAAHLAKGGKQGSGWHVVRIGLLGLVITLAIGFALAFLVPL